MSIEELTQVEAPPSPAVLAHRKRSLFFLMLAVGGVGFTMALQLGVNNNFIAQTMDLGYSEAGIVEAARESCGIVSIGVLALLAGLAEPIIGALMLMLLGVGLGAYCFVPDFGWLIMAGLVWSMGFHVWLPLPNSMALALAEPGKAGYRLGQLGSAGAAGAAIGLAATWALSHFEIIIHPKDYQTLRYIYLLAGSGSILAALACFMIPRAIKTPGPRLALHKNMAGRILSALFSPFSNFRRRYGLYYALNLLEGCRKQIFIAFAGFFLIKKFGVPLNQMLLLWIITQAICYMGAPWVGRLIDRFGERKVLTFYYFSMTLVFLGYSFFQSWLALFILFVLDGCFFTFTMAFTTYVNRLVTDKDRTATLSMGVAVNHVAAVGMPLLGAYVVGAAGPGKEAPHYLFYIGSAVAVISVITVLAFMPKRTTAAQPA